MTTDSIPQDAANSPSLVGFAALQASGSAQFSKESLLLMQSVIPSDRITVVDLRQESHGFINGTAISWYAYRGWSNLGMSREEVEKDEREKLQGLLELGYIIAYENKKFPIPTYVTEICTEQELTEELGLGYMRFAITDHLRPSDNDVDRFIKFIKSVPQGTWLHFHCSAGRGRSTTFLAMYDIMRNAHQVNLHDIIERQKRIGGVDLFHIHSADSWKHPHAIERAEFIKKFYQYSIENPHFTQSWTSWLRQQD